MARTAARPGVLVMGLPFLHPLGVAAGYDRDGARTAELVAAGFAFVEIGTINVEAASEGALAALAATLLRHRPSAPSSGRAILGVSLGSLRAALGTEAGEEIGAAARTLAGAADFIVVNLSRPNSAARDGGARTEEMRDLLRRVVERLPRSRPPLLVKVAVQPEDADAVPPTARLAAELGYDGIVVAFEHWPSVDAACARLAALRARLRRLAVIAVGGVRTANIARRYLTAGADLVEVYTAVAECGPSVARALQIFDQELAPGSDGTCAGSGEPADGGAGCA